MFTMFNFREETAMDKGKVASAKHHQGRRTRPVKTRSKSPLIKNHPVATGPAPAGGAAKPVAPKSNGNGTRGHQSQPLIIQDIAKDGLKAFTRLMEQLQSDPGTTLVLAHHLNPEHQRQLTELLLIDSKKEVAEAVQKLQNELAALRRDHAQLRAECSRLNDDFSNVMGTTREPLVIVGHDLRIKRCSRAAAELLNISPDDVGRKMTGAAPCLHIPDLQKIVANVMSTSTVVQQEIVNDLGKWFLFSAHPYATNDGKVDCAVLTFQDIDADKRNETLEFTLQAKERSYHDVVHDILMILDAQGCVMMINKSGCELLGRKEEEIIGKRWIDDCVPKSQWVVARAIFDQVMGRQLTGEYEYPVASTGGEERVIAWRTVLLKDQAGHITGMICSGEDLTLLRQINTALQKSEERFHVMMESVREDEFFIMDTEGYIASWIARPEEGKSYRAHEMVGQHFSRLFTPEDFQSGKPMRILDTAETEGRFEEDGWRMRKDGTRMRAYGIIIPIRDGARTLLGFSNVTRYMRDATEAQEASAPGFAFPLERMESR